MNDTRMIDPRINDARLTDGVLWRRVSAWCIDALIIAVIATVLWLVLMVFGVLTLGLGFPLLAVLPLVPIAYHVLFIAGGMTATPGQGIMGLSVRQADTLAAPDFAQAVVFTVGLWLTLATSGVWLLAALFMPQKRAIHDLVSGLVIVRSQALTRSVAFGTMA